MYCILNKDNTYTEERWLIPRETLCENCQKVTVDSKSSSAAIHELGQLFGYRWKTTDMYCNLNVRLLFKAEFERFLHVEKDQKNRNSIEPVFLASLLALGRYYILKSMRKPTYPCSLCGGGEPRDKNSLNSLEIAAVRDYMQQELLTNVTVLFGFKNIKMWVCFHDHRTYQDIFLWKTLLRCQNRNG